MAVLARFDDAAVSVEPGGYEGVARGFGCQRFHWNPSSAGGLSTCVWCREGSLAALTQELDQTFRTVATRLPQNPFVRFEIVDGKRDIVVSPLEKLEEPASLIALREAVAARLPRADLPELLLEIATRTGFPAAFVHISERTARAADLSVSLCAVLLAEACNTGLEPLAAPQTP